MSSDGLIRCGAERLLDLRWRVLRVGRPRHTAVMSGDDDPLTRHWAWMAEGEVVGAVSVMAEPRSDGIEWRLRGMAVAADRQRTGIGSRLLVGVHDEVGAPMWCDARLHAVPFYAAHGWQVRSEVYDVPHVGPHKRMVWPGP